MVNALKALLLRQIQNPILRSAAVNFGVVVGVAAVTTLDGELTTGRIDFRVIAGAAVAAAIKWAHSTATDLTNKAEAELATVTTAPPAAS